MGVIDVDRISAICANYSGPSYFCEEVIPYRKLYNFCKAISTTVQGHAIAFIDATVFGSGRNGMLITEAGVYWRNDWMSDTQKYYLNWVEFIQADIFRSGDYDIELGSGNLFSMSGSSFNKDVLIQLLQDIQSYVIKVLENPVEFNDENIQEEVSPPLMTSPTNKWMVAIAGQSYGPYDEYLIKSLLGTGQIQPEEAHVWKPGMPDWVPFMRQPEMAELVRPAMPPAPQEMPPAPQYSQAMPAQRSVAESIEAALDPGQSAYELELVDVNTASREELIEILGVGVSGAERIVQQREANGGFQSPEQVGELLGLRPHQVERLRKRAIFKPLKQPLSSSGPTPLKPNVRVVDY